MPDIILLVVILVVAGAGLVAALMALAQTRASSRRVDDTLTRGLQTGAEVSALRQALDSRLDSFTHIITNATYNIDNKLAAAGETIASVQRGVGELRESSTRVVELGRDIKRLQDILRPAQARGAVGEVLLENLLDQILPADVVFKQFPLGSEKVDFAVKLGDRYVPIDAKFPIEDYERFLAAGDAEKDSCRKALFKNVEKKIASIREKYIREDALTYNFALMYIPSEGLYYEVFVDQPRLFDVAAQDHVFPCSPSTVYVYLMTIALGLRGMDVEKRAGVVLAQLQSLGKDLSKFRDSFDTLGSHLRNASNKYDDAARSLTTFADKLDATGRSGSAELEGDAEPAPPQLFG